MTCSVYTRGALKLVSRFSGRANKIVLEHKIGKEFIQTKHLLWVVVGRVSSTQTISRQGILNPLFVADRQQRCDIDVRENLSANQFLADYLSISKPVLVRGALNGVKVVLQQLTQPCRQKQRGNSPYASKVNGAVAVKY